MKPVRAVSYLLVAVNAILFQLFPLHTWNAFHIKRKKKKKTNQPTKNNQRVLSKGLRVEKVCIDPLHQHNLDLTFLHTPKVSMDLTIHVRSFLACWAELRSID